MGKMDTELERLRQALQETDPKTELYGVLLARYKLLLTLEMAEEKQAEDIEFRKKEFDWKVEKETDDYNAKVDIENNRVTMEEKRINLEYEKLDVERERNKIEAEKVKNDKIKTGSESLNTGIKTAGDIIQTSMKVGGQLYVTAIGTKALLAVAKGILSDEESGKLVYSKLFSLLKTPNPFSFKF